MSIDSLVSRGIPEKVSNFLLSYFDGDIEKVYKVLNFLKKDIVVLKLKFSFSLYSGIALLFVNQRSLSLDLVKCFVSHSTEITKVNIEIPWKEILKKISEDYKSLQIDVDLSARAEKVFYSDTKFVQTLMKVLSEDKTFLDTKRFLHTYVPLLLGDPNTIVRFSTEKIDIFQFFKFLKESNMELPESLKPLSQEDSSSSFPILELSIQPILSPLDGIPINLLSIGDEMQIKIVDTDDLSRSFIKGEGIVSGRISNIKKIDNERSLIYVEIGPGFGGSFVIKNDVKVKSISKSFSQNIHSNQVSQQPKYQDTNLLQDRNKVEKLSSREIEEKIEKEKDSSLIFWIINLTIIGFGIAIVIIILFLL